MTHAIELAVVQFQPVKGDRAGNLERLSALFSGIIARGTRPDVVSLPETVLTGYFLEGGVREVACSAEDFARDLNTAFCARCDGSMDVVAGFYELYRNTYYNSAVYATLGGADPEILHVHRKVFLPTYGLFDEERFVEHGLEVRAFDTRWGRAALLICEDVWHSITTTSAALDGAQVVFVPSASPGRGVWPQPDEEVRGPASMHRWERLARDRAEEHGIYMVVTQLVGNEGGKAFPGGSVVAGPHGDVRGRAPLWNEAVLQLTLDLDDITRARASSPLLADLRIMLPHMMRALGHAAGSD